MGTCAFGRKTTDRVKNSDSITFGSSIGSTPNRFVFQMDTWPVCKNSYVLLLHTYIVCEKGNVFSRVCLFRVVPML